MSMSILNCFFISLWSVDVYKRQAKGFAMVVYDYKFPTLATKLYYHYKRNEKLGRVPKGCKFNMINFVDVEYSRRVNPIPVSYTHLGGDGEESVNR